VANGITAIRVLSGAPDLPELREKVRGSEVLGPRMLVGSPMLDAIPQFSPNR
jgi:hypothetical protein